jgi:hypothetical protein
LVSCRSDSLIPIFQSIGRTTAIKVQPFKQQAPDGRSGRSPDRHVEIFEDWFRIRFPLALFGPTIKAVAENSASDKGSAMVLEAMVSGKVSPVTIIQKKKSQTMDMRIFNTERCISTVI